MTQEADVFRSELLESNVQVVGQPMEGVESAAIGIAVSTGARDETAPHFGITHFTEQMLFRGTEDLDARQLSERFDALGIEYDSTAGLEMTLLTAVLIGDRLPEAIDLLAEVIRQPSFPADAVDSVRDMIVQELRQREDRPGQKVMETLRQKYFAGSPLGHDVLGTQESANAIDRDDLVEYWRERYTTGGMVISVAGNFDWDRLIEQLREVSASWRRGNPPAPPPTPAPGRGITVIERDTAQENIGFAFPAVAAGDERFYAVQLLSQALGGGMNSRLFREVREKKSLAYAIQSRADGLQKAGLFRVYVGTTTERAHESVETIMDELRKLERDGITEDELRLAKTRVKSQVIMRSESTSARMAANLRSWWYEGKLHSLAEVQQRIDGVTLDDVRELAQTLGITEKLTVVALGPRSEDELFGRVLTPS